MLTDCAVCQDMAEKKVRGTGTVTQHGKAKGDIGFFSEMLACITLVSQNDLDFIILRVLTPKLTSRKRGVGPFMCVRGIFRVTMPSHSRRHVYQWHLEVVTFKRV